MGEGEGKKETLARKPPYFEKRPRVICAWKLSKVANGKLAETLTSVKNKGLVSCMLKSTIHSTKSKEFIYFGESNDSNSSEMRFQNKIRKDCRATRNGLPQIKVCFLTLPQRAKKWELNWCKILQNIQAEFAINAAAKFEIY